MLISISALIWASSAQAAVCANEGIRLEQAYNSQLPDCRAYEQVSPVEKNLSSAIGHAGLVQVSVSPNNEGPTRVSYGAFVPFPGTPGSSEYPTYLATRASDGSGWSTLGLLPASPGPKGQEPAASFLVSGLTADLSYAVLENSQASTGALYDVSAGRLLEFPFADEEFVDASTNDSTILVASNQSLHVAQGSPTGIGGEPNLYEWHEGALRLVAADAAAGPDLEPEHRIRAYTEHVISMDGTRVFYSSPAAAAGEGRIYMRENLGEPVPISAGVAEWRAATPDGSSVFYTEGGGVRRGEGVIGGLYRWTWRPGEAGPHTVQIAEPSTNVLGTLGVSNDGSYVYFVAEGKLGGKNAQGEEAVEGEPNLYVWHEEGGAQVVAFIATTTSSVDTENWHSYFYPEPNGPAEGLKSSQVTPEGTTLLFTSILPLTHYENQKHNEIFLYDAMGASLTCVSCNPSGAPASIDAYLLHQPIKYAAQPAGRNRPFALHNLSEDGQRVFFQSAEALTPRAENGLANVYEWENGQIYLISSGQGAGPAYLGDASANGSDVFFFTGQSLVMQDQDENIDLYDAHENGGIAAQNEGPRPDCGEQCHGAGSAPPSFGVPASYTFVGSSDVASRTLVGPVAKPRAKSHSKPKCKRGYRRHSGGKCARIRASRQKR